MRRGREVRRSHPRKGRKMTQKPATTNQRTKEEKKAWNDAIDSVLELMRISPPHRVGEAMFITRLKNLKER